MEETSTRKKTYSYFIGIDVSKNELDYAVMRGKELLFHEERMNEPEDIADFVAKLKAIPGFRLPKALFCMEHTGFYNNHLLHTLKKVKANVTQQNALRIKASLGIIRGKDDKADAIRIAQFAQKNSDELKLWEPRRKVVLELTSVFALRSRLLRTLQAMKTAIKEQDAFIKREMHQQSSALCRRSISAVEEDLKTIESVIDKLVLHDPGLKRQLHLILTVPGVGRITGLQLIISTNEFRDINDPKKFACYAGIAPFKNESGKTAKKTRISPFANKKMKSLLHMCAINSIQWNEELRAYFIRKTEVEGKPKRSVVNALRNKLVLRIFACIKHDREFRKEYIGVNEITAS